MRKRVALISNICIALVLAGLGVAVFTTDLSNAFLTVGAPIYNGDRSKANVSLMFVVDDDARCLTEIMELLKSRNTPATFFVGGKWADAQSPKTVIDLASGFELGNYGYSNQNLTKMNESGQRREIENCHFRIKGITAGTPINQYQGNETVAGVEMKLFSPPGGAFNRNTLKSAERLGYRTVMWSKNATEGTIYERATADIMNGDLVLLKPSAATFGALGQILDRYAELGLTPAAVSKNIES